MEEAEQCDRLVIMVDGRVSASGTVAEIVGDRTVTEVRSTDWRRAFIVLDTEGSVVRVRGETLRVAKPVPEVSRLLAREGVVATLGVARSDLEEAFVSIVQGDPS
jgi:ABC-type multidrug transport system ATPase subunit